MIFDVYFENLFKEHCKSLHGYALSIVKDDFQAEELVHNVFLKIWEKRQQIVVEQSAKAYLFRAVHNECMDYLKKQQRERNFLNHYEIETQTSSTDYNKHLELELKYDLALNKLPTQCRKVFEMSRIEEKKYKDIAAHLGISIKTVENQMGKALKLLRQELHELVSYGILFIIVL